MAKRDFDKKNNLPARKAPNPIKPIVIGCFTLHERGMDVEGTPTFAEYEAVGDFIERASKASSWWVADWVRYGEARKDWKERFEQICDVTKYSERTVRNYKYIGENVPPSNRRDDVDFTLHAEVASLSHKEQRVWLERAAENGWSVRDLRMEIRAASRPKTVAGQAHLEGMFRVIYADPPWLYSDSGATQDGSLGKASRHYPGMTIDQLCALPVKAHVLPDSILFMWVTAPLLLQKPGPREVLEAWGFEYKTNFAWDKVLGMPGHYANHTNHEHLIIAARGSCLPDRPTPQEKSVYVERRSNVHSEKPEHYRQFIEKHWDGPYLELFGRKRVEGWTVFGNDARLWAKQAGGADVKDEDIPF